MIKNKLKIISPSIIKFKYIIIIIAFISLNFTYKSYFTFNHYKITIKLNFDISNTIKLFIIQLTIFIKQLSISIFNTYF